MVRFLTLEAIKAEYDRLARSYEELPEPAKRCVKPIAPGEVAQDYATCFKEGWRWMFEGLQRHQPKAFSALEARNPSLLYGERLWPDRLRTTVTKWACNGFVQLGDVYFVFHPDTPGNRMDQRGDDHPAFERYDSLPQGIAAAYYSRLRGIEVVYSLPVNAMSSRVLPAGIRTWLSATSLCTGGKKERTKMFAALRSVADNPRATDDDLDESFFILLDTREQDDFEPEGDFLLVNETSRSRRIYHIRDSDFTTLSVLADPVRTMDEYVAHIFSGASGTFDFRPHLQSL